LVERTTRFTILLHLPPDEEKLAERARTATGVRGAVMGHGAEAVRDAIAAAITTLPMQLRRSLTWDQGAEMARQADLRIEHGLPVYFCDPNTPWQRGTNENTNGLLRQYFPQGTDLTAHGPDVLDAVAAALNGRPRNTLGWKTPAEALDRLLNEKQNVSVASETALRPLVGMVDDAPRLPLADRHVECIEDELRPEVRAHGPAHDPPREGIRHDGEVEEAGPGRNAGQIRHPELVRRVGVEVAIEQVASWAHAIVADRGSCALAPADAGQTVAFISRSTRLRPTWMPSSVSSA
jgi:hypothetical protein